METMDSPSDSNPKKNILPTKHEYLVPEETQEDNFLVPAPQDPTPPLKARIVFFITIIVGGSLGGLSGYAVTSLFSNSPYWLSLGILAGSITSGLGIGLIALLAMQSMAEWETSAKKNRIAAANRMNKDILQEK